MIKRVTSLLGLLVLMTFVSAAAHADDMLIKATVPFSFTLGDTTLPAGEYRILRANTPARLYYIRSADGKQSMYFAASTVEPLNESERVFLLVFDRIGDSYFLSKVWMGSRDIGLLLPKSKHERELLANRAESRRIDLTATNH